MTIFVWQGGDIGLPTHWVSSGTTSPGEPGLTDTAIFSVGGEVTGSANVGAANFAGGYIFSGANLSAGNETVFSGGSIVQKDGINAIVSASNVLALFGSYTLSGGTLSGSSAAELVSGGFKQISGANTIGDLQIGRSTYTLSGGTLAVVSGLDGDEFVGLGNASGGFIQSGGTHIVARALEIGFQNSGTYVLSAGLLSMPVSGPAPNNGYGEFIGENSGGVGTFVQTGGTNSVADRVVVGTTSLGGASNASGTYVLGGSGVLDVNTLFVGSEQGCSGTFNFNTSKGDNAQLTISGTDTFFPGLIVGGDGIGTFVQGGVFGTSVQGGGTVSASSLEVGRHYDGTGSYILSAGALSASEDETIGVAGSGTFKQKFGSNTVGCSRCSLAPSSFSPQFIFLKNGTAWSDTLPERRIVEHAHVIGPANFIYDATPMYRSPHRCSS